MTPIQAAQVAFALVGFLTAVCAPSEAAAQPGPKPSAGTIRLDQFGDSLLPLVVS